MSTDADTVREALDCLVDEREARGGRVADVAHAIAALDRLAAAEARAETITTAIREHIARGHDQFGELAAALAAVTPTDAAEKRSAPENPSNVTRY